METVKLGYAVGSGDVVRIPIAHTIITGQTQLSGKTTTLDALAGRADVRALAFLTKRGETLFEGSIVNLVQPYFRERADWQFVEAILEATMRQRMKFERSWIMKAARAARTLDHVRKNITRLMTNSREGLGKDVYMMLGEYLDQVLPVLRSVRFADKVELQPGLNVVDLRGMAVEVQGLVIASMLQWVHEKERDVIVVLPESWKFIPQGRNSPVRMAAVSIAREGAAIGNLLWLDSQDIAGAEKEILRQASVWLIGVQRERNEVKRTLDQIPGQSPRPSVTDVMQLKRGQFYACFGTTVVLTYVQPAWMEDFQAQRIARGEVTPATSARLPRPAPAAVEAAAAVAVAALTDPEMAAAGERQRTNQPQEDVMNPAQEKKLDTLISTVSDLVVALGNKAAAERAGANTDAPNGNGSRPIAPDHFPVGKLDEEAIVDRVIERLRKTDPKTIRVLLERPELQVEIKREVITADGRSLRGRIARMHLAGDFDGDGMNGKATTRALQDAGFKCSHPQVYAEMDELTELGFFRISIKPGNNERRYVAVKDDRIAAVTK